MSSLDRAAYRAHEDGNGLLADPAADDPADGLRCRGRQLLKTSHFAQHLTEIKAGDDVDAEGGEYRAIL